VADCRDVGFLGDIAPDVGQFAAGSEIEPSARKVCEVAMGTEKEALVSIMWIKKGGRTSHT
jgi:hypothetical protein